MAKQTRAEFAAKIKSKYPQYESMDDNELVDKITAKYPQYLDQISEDQGNVEAPEDGASKSEDTSSELVQGHKIEDYAKAQAIKSMTSRIAPDFLVEMAGSFINTLGGIAGGVVGAVEQHAARRAIDLKEDGKLTPEQAAKVISEDASPEERAEFFKEWSKASDAVEESTAIAGALVDQHGTGSVTQELAKGNYTNAAKIQANNAASGIASLIPFFVPGGQVLGPTILGSSAVGSSFKEDIADIEKTKDATLDQITYASYGKGGVEFATELITGRILGTAQKMAAGGASQQAVNEMVKSSMKYILGESWKEGLSEGLSDTFTKAIDKYVYDKDYTQLEYLTGFIDNFLTGAIIGGKVATFGDVARKENARQLAANILKTDQQKADTQERIDTANGAQEIIDELEKKDTEGSLVDEVTLEEAKRVRDNAIQEEKDAQKEHMDVLDDMTESELKEYAEQKDKADKLKKKKKEVEKKAEAAQETADTSVLDSALDEAELRMNTAYNTVKEWNNTTKAIDETVKKNEEVIEEEKAKLEDAAQQQQQPAAEGKPKPKKSQKQKVAEKKSKEKIKRAEENVKALNKIKDEARPTHADAKTRKRKVTPTPVAPTAVKPIKDKAKRDDANKGLIDTITDPSIPSGQKEKAWSDFFKINSPLIDSVARTAANKANTNVSKDIKDRVKSEIAAQINKNGKFDRKTINNAGQKVYRDIKQEQQTVKTAPTEAGLKEELREIDQQVQDGILDPEAAEILKDDIRAEYQETARSTGLTIESEGDVVISPEVEAATQTEREAGDAEIIAKAMAGKTVDGLVDDMSNNTDTIYALLPKSAKTGKAFSGIFKEGSPALEIWESYFDPSDRQGKDRVRQLKKAIQQRIDDATLDSEGSTSSEMFDQAMQFLEKPHKAKPRTIKEIAPLLGKLKRAFPNTKIIVSKAKMMERLIESDQVDAAASVQANNIKGFVDPNTGDVLINEDALDYETPIHEFGHLWAQAARSSRYEFYRKGIELLEGSSIYKEIFDRAKNPKSVYHGLTKNQLEEEVMATAIGRYGEQMFDAVGDQKNWDSWVKNMFNWLGQQLGLEKPFQDLTASEFMNIAVTEIISGKGIVTKRDTEIMKASLVTPVLEGPAFHELDSFGYDKQPNQGGKKIESAEGWESEHLNSKRIHDKGTYFTYSTRNAPRDEYISDLEQIANDMLEAVTNGSIKVGGARAKGLLISSGAIKPEKKKEILNIFASRGLDIKAEKNAKKYKNATSRVKNAYKNDKGIVAGRWIVQPRLVDPFNFLEVPSGTTKDYTPSVPPLTEFDTHGVFKGQSVKNELYTGINRYFDELQAGAWMAWTTGSYGDQVINTPKFNPKLNARIESKVKTAKELVEGEGLQFKRDPRNPGIHIISKPMAITGFLETPKQQEAAAIHKATVKAIKAALKPYKKASPYKYSRVDSETAEVLKATLADLEQRGDTLSKEVIDQVAAKVKEVVKIGKATRKDQKKVFAERKAKARDSANEMIKESGVDPNISKSEARLLAKKADSWKNKIFGRDALANILSPATNADFYTLLYNLLPKGKTRETARAIIDQLLIKPLEKANIDYLNSKARMRQNWIDAKAYAMTGKVADKLTPKELKKALNDANNLMNQESTVEFGGRNLRNYDIVKVYNYMKDPSTYRALNKTFTQETLDQIVDYVQGQESLKGFADVIPGVYSGVASEINAKLDSHGRQTFSKKRINRDALSPEEISRLEKINGGTLPLFSKYTPLTSEGTDTDTDVDKLLNDNQYAMYTVMDGRLKERTGGGEIIVHGNNLDGDFDTYLNGPVRTMAFLDFAQNASDFFGTDQMNAMKAAYGDQWQKAMKDSLRRIVTGKNQPAKQNAATRALDKWINRTVGTVMTLNTRSALLQLISTSNFIVNDPKAVFDGLNATKAEKALVRDFLKNSEWAKERGKGKVDLAVDSIFNDDKPGFVDTVLQKGYVLTKLGDKFAITTGGAPYMIGKYKQYTKDGMTPSEALQKAYADFVAQAEETQQSTRPERLGQSQTTQMGKLILAFANTPMQYNRKMVRAIKDITAKGTDPKRKAQAGRELLYYGAAQNVVFTALQRLMLPGVSGDVEDEAGAFANNLANTLLRGIGVWGAVVAGLKDALIAASDDKDIFEPLVNIAPALGTKIRHLRTALGTKSIYAQSDLIDDPLVYQISSGINVATNLPADRAVKVVEQVGDSFSSDFEWYQAALRALGWSRYDLGEPAGESPLNRLARGEMGQAHRDGTIEVDPNLTPLEREKTIKHEKKHVRDMDSGKLDYDDNYVYYNDSKYARKDGKINYNGKWYEEGDKGLPWEAAAYAAEGSPLKSTGDSTKRRDKTRKDVSELKRQQEKYGEKYGQAFLEPTGFGHQVKFGAQRVEDLDPREALKQTAAQQFIGDWETNPETIKRFQEQFPDIATEDFLTKANQRALLTSVTDFKEGERMNDQHYGRYVPEEGIRLAPGDTGALEVHERTHAGGLDVLRGAHAADIIGGVVFKDLFGDIDDATSDYVNNPQEVGAYLQQARFDGGFKPGQEVTEDMVRELIEKSSDKNLLLKGVKANDKIKELTRAFNEVAYQEENNPEIKQKSLKDLYVKNSNTRLT